jgi:cellulose synthase/poly-beta-1,6-N-acetylglucosamine synthase-like glycosyltransferase
VPLLREMYSEKLAGLQYYLMIPAIAGIVISLILDAGPPLLFSLIILLAGTILFVINMIKILVR